MEFADFVDTIGLPADWSQYFQLPEPGPDDDIVEAVMREQAARTQARANLAAAARTDAPFISWLPSAPVGNHVADATWNESGPYQYTVPCF